MTTPAHDELGLQEAATEVRALLRDAVQRRLIADRPLGAFLSGGIDSSAVVGLMSELSNQPVRTFTIGFEDSEGFDERPYARSVADRFRTDHVEFVVRPNAVDLIEQLVWHHDQPFGDSSAIPTYLLSELTQRHVTVALSGDGGGELFAGYERFAAAHAATLYQQLAPVANLVIDRLTRPALSRPQSRLARVRRFAGAAELGLPDSYLSWLG